MDHLEKCRRTQSTMFIIEDDDILTEILLRLSTKSVVQLKSVCKRWCSLISSHHFSVLHTLHHPTITATTATLIFRKRRYKCKYPSLQPNHSYKINFPFTTSGYIIQSCHGLLLCGSNNAHKVYYIYNLATRLWRSFVFQRNEVETLSLAFDPSKSAYYKLICVKPADFLVGNFEAWYNQTEEWYYRIDVFDSKLSTWSVVLKSFTASSDVNLSHGIYWNNAIHWEESSNGSMYFDVDKGVIGTSPKVPRIPCIRYHEGIMRPCLMESGGHLHYIINDGSNLGVLELERDYSKWSIKYQVEYSGLSNAFPEFPSLIGLVRTQNEEQSVLLFEVSDKLVAYNLIDESFEELLS